MTVGYRSRKRQMEIKAALAEARRNQEAQFAKDWQDRLKQLKAEEVCWSAIVLSLYVLIGTLPTHCLQPLVRAYHLWGCFLISGWVSRFAWGGQAAVISGNELYQCDSICRQMVRLDTFSVKYACSVCFRRVSCA